MYTEKEWKSIKIESRFDSIHSATTFVGWFFFISTNLIKGKNWKVNEENRNWKQFRFLNENEIFGCVWNHKIH